MQPGAHLATAERPSASVRRRSKGGGNRSARPQAAPAVLFMRRHSRAQSLTPCALGHRCHISADMHVRACDAHCAPQPAQLLTLCGVHACCHRLSAPMHACSCMHHALARVCSCPVVLLICALASLDRTLACSMLQRLHMSSKHASHATGLRCVPFTNWQSADVGKAWKVIACLAVGGAQLHVAQHAAARDLRGDQAQGAAAADRVGLHAHHHRPGGLALHLFQRNSKSPAASTAAVAIAMMAAQEGKPSDDTSRC